MKPKAPKKKDSKPNCKTGEVKESKEYYLFFDKPTITNLYHKWFKTPHDNIKDINNIK